MQMWDPNDDPLFGLPSSSGQERRVDKDKEWERETEREKEKGEGRDLTNVKLAKNQLVRPSSPLLLASRRWVDLPT